MRQPGWASRHPPQHGRHAMPPARAAAGHVRAVRSATAQRQLPRHYGAPPPGRAVRPVPHEPKWPQEHRRGCSSAAARATGWPTSQTRPQPWPTPPTRPTLELLDPRAHLPDLPPRAVRARPTARWSLARRARHQQMRRRMLWQGLHAPANRMRHAGCSCSHRQRPVVQRHQTRVPASATAPPRQRPMQRRLLQMAPSTSHPLRAQAPAPRQPHRGAHLRPSTTAPRSRALLLPGQSARAALRHLCSAPAQSQRPQAPSPCTRWRRAARAPRDSPPSPRVPCWIRPPVAPERARAAARLVHSAAAVAAAMTRAPPSTGLPRLRPLFPALPRRPPPRLRPLRPRPPRRMTPDGRLPPP
mmetsp:Transcript_20074/g.64032  ORF Transcript_20074/g.64032 Transcript_20074/m.64032 type:complete len:357 (-) Transcript_20074:801-1871(-)